MEIGVPLLLDAEQYLPSYVKNNMADACGLTDKIGSF